MAAAGKIVLGRRNRLGWTGRPRPPWNEAMFKKLVSKALLPLVMDKAARKKLEKVRAAKDAATQESAATERPETVEDLEDELVEPGKGRVRPAKTPPAAGKGAGRPVSADREELIRQALVVRRTKAKVLDNLSREEKERLYVVAMKTLVDKDFGEKRKKKK